MEISTNTVWALVLSLSFISAVCANPASQEQFFGRWRHRRDDDIIDNNITESSNEHTSDAFYQASDVIDLADLEATLIRANNNNINNKVVLSRGVPQLKINGTVVETNEGTRKLLIFITNAKRSAGGEGFRSSSTNEMEGLRTTQMEYLGPNGIRKRENRYEVSYWNYKYYHDSETHELIEKYEVKVMCQPSPPGHTLSVNGHTISSGSAVWHLTISEACRFWKA